MLSHILNLMKNTLYNVDNCVKKSIPKILSLKPWYVTSFALSPCSSTYSPFTQLYFINEHTSIQEKTATEWMAYKLCFSVLTDKFAMSHRTLRNSSGFRRLWGLGRPASGTNIPKNPSGSRRLKQQGGRAAWFKSHFSTRFIFWQHCRLQCCH